PTCGLNAKQECTGDAFVARLNVDGSLDWATYLGGSSEDAANGIALDAQGNIYVAGFTSSAEFPVFRGFQLTPGGEGDAFVAKISADGAHVLYATYLGGGGPDEALGLAVDKESSVYVTGRTESGDFATRNAFQTACGGRSDARCRGTAFVSKLSPDGSSLVYSTYLGGSGGDTGTAIAVDGSGQAYVAGSTLSDDFPVAAALQGQTRGQSETFITKFLPDGSGLVYSTFLGGSGDDFATSLAIDALGDVFVAGRTTSADFPMQGPVQAECSRDSNGICTQDAFLAVLNPTGRGLRFASYLGGRGVDQGKGIAVDSKGSVYLGGATTSADFPLARALPLPAGAIPEAGAKPRARVLTNAEVGRSADSGSSGGGVLAVISGLSAQQSCSGSINWTGLAGDNQWTSVNNWDTHVLPIASDSVCIGTAFSANTINIGSISSATNQTIASLVSNANITFSTGPLTVSGGATFVNALTINGGVLTLGGTNGSTVGGAMTLGAGTLAGTDTLTINGLLTWTSNGAMCTNSNCTAPQGQQAVTNANGGIAGSGSQIYLEGRTLNNPGVANLNNTSGALTLYYGSVINNLANASWNLPTDFGISVSTGGGTFNNAGTFSKTGGTGTSTIGVAFNNSGVVQANTGALNFQAVGNSTGPGVW